MTATTLAAVAAAVAVLAGLAFLARLHLAPTGLRPAQDAVSAYGIGPFHAWYRAMAVAFGLGALLLAWALGRRGGVGGGGLALLVTYGVARVALAAFPTDAEGAPPSLSGRIHVLLAAAAFSALAVATPIISSALALQPAWPESGEMLRSISVTVIAGCAMVFAAALLARLRPWFGGFQRLFYVVSQAWLLMVAVQVAWQGGN